MDSKMVVLSPTDFKRLKKVAARELVILVGADRGAVPRLDAEERPSRRHGGPERHGLEVGKVHPDALSRSGV